MGTRGEQTATQAEDAVAGDSLGRRRRRRITRNDKAGSGLLRRDSKKVERWNFEDRPAILHGAGVSTLKRRKRNFKQHAGGYNAQRCAFPFGKPFFYRCDECLV